MPAGPRCPAAAVSTPLCPSSAVWPKLLSGSRAPHSAPRPSRQTPDALGIDFADPLVVEDEEASSCIYPRLVDLHWEDDRHWTCGGSWVAGHPLSVQGSCTRTALDHAGHIIVVGTRTAHYEAIFAAFPSLANYVADVAGPIRRQAGGCNGG